VYPHHKNNVLIPSLWGYADFKFLPFDPFKALLICAPSTSTFQWDDLNPFVVELTPRAIYLPTSGYDGNQQCPATSDTSPSSIIDYRLRSPHVSARSAEVMRRITCDLNRERLSHQKACETPSRRLIMVSLSPGLILISFILAIVQLRISRKYGEKRS
jgi:hypothetical protein